MVVYKRDSFKRELIYQNSVRDKQGSNSFLLSGELSRLTGECIKHTGEPARLIGGLVRLFGGCI